MRLLRKRQERELGHLIRWSLFAVSLTAGVAQGAPDLSVSNATCPTLFRSVVALSQNASFADIHSAFAFSAKNRVGIPELDGQRLINEEDWPKAVAQFPQQPWRYYGQDTIADWLEGLRFINRDADGMPIGPDLLKKIHGITARSLKFHGYEGRRIRKLFEEGKLTEAEFTASLKLAYEEDHNFSGTDHALLRGQLRSDPVDLIRHYGSSVKSDGKRYLSLAELEAIRANPFMKVEEAKIQEFEPGKFDGFAYYVPSNQVEKKTAEVLETASRELGSAKSKSEIARAVVKMEKDLVSVHPFLDGNGRSIRLLGDLILARHGLPPSLRPNESDLVMSIDEAVEFRRRGMIDYLNALERRR